MICGLCPANKRITPDRAQNLNLYAGTPKSAMGSLHRDVRGDGLTRLILGHARMSDIIPLELIANGLRTVSGRMVMLEPYLTCIKCGNKSAKNVRHRPNHDAQHGVPSI